jgi:hypothetical protein
VLNLSLFAGLGAWIAADGQFREPVLGQRVGETAQADGGFQITAANWAADLSPGRRQALASIGWGVAATLAAMAVGLFLGAARQRRLRSWLALTAVCAAWLGLWVLWPELAWAGKRWRVSRDLGDFAPIVRELRHDWPRADDVSPAIGPFQAYPNGAPTILMPLLKPSGRENHAPFSVVERSRDGALRFELVGNESGAWLEWHPRSSAPASFTGGLETRYELVRSSRLGDGWYLTRYRTNGLAQLEL